MKALGGILYLVNLIVLNICLLNLIDVLFHIFLLVDDNLKCEIFKVMFIKKKMLKDSKA